MSNAPRIGVGVLAAGASSRFGKADKLAQTFRDRPLGEHAAIAIPRTRCSHAWMITSRPRHRCEAAWRECRFEPVINPDCAKGMGTSLALAAALAKQARCDALLIALADMPLVPRAHFDALIDAFANGALVASSDTGSALMPPAIFDASLFDELKNITGDKGARALIQSGVRVACPPGQLIDIDSPRDLQKYGQA